MTDPFAPPRASSWSSPATVKPQSLSGVRPPRAARLLQRAERWFERNDPQAAEQALREAIAIVPDDPALLRLLAVALHRQGRHAEALPLLQRARSLRPDDATIENNLGSALAESGDMQGALDAFRHACELEPSLAVAWFNLGAAHDALLQTAAAEAAFAEALSLDPQHQQARIQRACCLRTLGRLDDAASEFRAVLDRHPDSGDAWVGLLGMQSTPADANALTALEGLYPRARRGDRERILLGFAYALALDAHARHDEAFAVIAEINAEQRAQTRWDAQGFSRIMRSIAQAFDGAIAAADDPRLGHEVIFVVGMPRSGSTLAEQILGAHPQVHGAGEIDDLAVLFREESKRRGVDFPGWVGTAAADDWTRLGNAYLERTARWREQRPRMTDKSLHNWQLVGAIRAMLPGAQVVDCRRDPLETCWSAFKHPFRPKLPYTCDFEELAAYWRDYDRLVRFWHARYPGYVWTQDYEALLADPEQRIRALLDRCGLAFDPACLRFHEAQRDVRTSSSAQVRRPLRSDTARAGLYGARLDPLRRALGVAS